MARSFPWTSKTARSGTAIWSSKVRGWSASACGGICPVHIRYKRPSTQSTATRPRAADTDWAQILILYDQLLVFDPSPVVALNRAVALGEVEGPAAGLAAVERLPLESYYLFHAVRADLFRRLSRPTDAAAAYDAARARTGNEAERAFLAHARAALEADEPPRSDRLVVAMKVHLVDGTYELFRHFFGAPPHRTAAGQEVAAVRGVVGSVLQLLGEGATHVGVATDHVIESFRNDLWPGYKTGEGVEPDLWSQAWPLEDALRALGVVVWPMVEVEADDALASAAAVAADDPEVEQVIICTPDKDLGQCVRGTRVVQLDRRKDIVIDEGGVTAKFGVGPASIPDYLALVGDSADGFPGLAGWGAKSAATVLARWHHVEEIPADSDDWDVVVRSAAKLATTLDQGREDARLFKELATLRIDRSLLGHVDELRWRGPTDDFTQLCADLDAPGIARRAEALAASRSTSPAWPLWPPLRRT